MAQQTYLKQVSGGLTEVKTVETSAGAADANKVPNTGAAGTLDPTLLNAVAASAGAGSAGKVVLLDGTGKLDATVLPTGIGSDALSMTASEAIAAGAYVNIWNSSGPKVRNADAATARPAQGFCPIAIASGQAGLVYFEGSNTGVSARTPGANQFIGAAGAGSETAPTASGAIVQLLGIAISTTSVSFEPHQPITLA